MAPTADLEFVGETNELGAACGARRLVLRFLRGGIALGLRDRLQLEFLHRAGHFAEFVLAPEPGQHDVEIAAGEFTHRLAHRGHRPRDSGAQQERPDDAEQEAAGGQHQDQLLGLADGCMRLGLEPLLIGQQVRLHRARAFVDGRSRIRHLGGQFVDLLRILDQLGERLPVFLQQGGGFLEPLHDLFFLGGDRLHRVLDELEARHRAGGDRLVGIDDEGIGKRRRRLKLVDHFLGAELDRLKFRIVGVAGEIVELVTQRGAAAGKLVLRDRRALFLDLEDIGKYLGEGAEFPLQLGDLVEPRRVGGAFHRLDDGVPQAGFGRQRRLAVLFLGSDDKITRQRAVRDQLAVDVAGQVGLRDALAVGSDARGYPLEAHIGKAHAGGRNRQRDGKAEHDLGTETKGWEFDRSRPATS